MEEVTLKVNIIVGGQHYLRGSVVSKDLLPLRLRTSKYIVRGAVPINRVMPIDMVEVGEEEMEEQGESPMRELTMGEIQNGYEDEEEEEKPRARIKVNKRISRR